MSTDKLPTNKMWGGRFTEAPASVMEEINTSLDFDKRLAREDIAVVLDNLEKQGYHLQMPPPEDDYIEHLPEELLRRNDPV